MNNSNPITFPPNPRTNISHLLIQLDHYIEPLIYFPATKFTTTRTMRLRNVNRRRPFTRYATGYEYNWFSLILFYTSYFRNILHYVSHDKSSLSSFYEQTPSAGVYVWGHNPGFATIPTLFPTPLCLVFLTSTLLLFNSRHSFENYCKLLCAGRVVNTISFPGSLQLSIYILF